MAAIKKVGIALPEEVLNEIDELAEKNFSNRSHTIVRIWLEWKALKTGQAETSSKDTEPKLNLALAA